MDESRTQPDRARKYQQISHDLSQNSLDVDPVDRDDQQPSNDSSAAAKVLGTTELLELIFLEPDQRSLRTTLPRVCKAFQQTILGSTKLQRSLHNKPNWKQTKFSPAPIPPSAMAFTTHRNGLFDHDTAPAIHPSSRHRFNMRFNPEAVAWAANPYSTTNAAFRNMLVCQPPVVAVEIFCFASVCGWPKLEHNRVENGEGVTCGELFDLVRVSAPVKGDAQIGLVFAGGVV
jgi:hypothetical protein